MANEPIRVLVVDDKEGARDGVRLTLHSLYRKIGYEITEAETGEAGLEMLRETHKPGMKPFDLIVTDIDMPEKDGLQMAQEWRKEEEQRRKVHIPMVIHTGLPDDSSPDTALSRAEFVKQLPGERGEVAFVDKNKDGALKEAIKTMLTAKQRQGVGV